jgi:flavin reductase (DIM6/NTAB) family NADH-FMN oxidoreductase RutF
MLPSMIPSVDRDLFIDAMSGAVTGVSVVTTDGTGGCVGITVSAVSSVSADPPLVLVCVNRRSPAANAIRDNGVFAVSLLSTSQVLVSDTFAGRASNGPAFDFDCAEWHVGPTGCRLLSGAVSSFDCVVQIAQDAGSHTVFIGRVIHVTAAAQEPLAHSRRRYCTTTRLSNNPAARAALDRSERVTGR